MNKNLNRFTKSDLINKLRKLELNNSSSKNNKNNNIKSSFISLFTSFMNIILTFKNLIVKITIISLVIKIFKKYSIIRRVWVIFNTILVSIFGISVIDNLGLDMFKNFYNEIISIFTNIIQYLTTTQFYITLSNLFNKNIDKVENKSSKMRTINKSSNGDEKSSKVIEWFNKIDDKKETLDEDTPIYKNKYVIIGGIIIISCISYYYWDSIKELNINDYHIKDLWPFLTGLLKRNKSKDDNSDKSSNKSSSSSNTDIILENETLDNKNIFNKFIDKYWRKNDNKGKNILDGELSQDEINRRKVELKINQDKRSRLFDSSSTSLINEINYFIYQHDNFSESFNGSKEEVAYSVVKNHLYIIKNGYSDLYHDWIDNNPNYKLTIDRFLNIELNNSSLIDNNYDNYSDTYQEIVNATAEEQAAWSDRSSPTPTINQIVSPNNYSNDISSPIDTTLVDQDNKSVSDSSKQNLLSKFTNVISDFIEGSSSNDLLNQSDVDNSINNDNNLSDISDELIDSFDKIKVNVFYGDTIDKRQVNIQFGQLWKDIDEVQIINDDNYLIPYTIPHNILPDNPNLWNKINDTYHWDNRGKSDSFNPNQDIMEIRVIDKNRVAHSIYKNLNLYNLNNK